MWEGIAKAASSPWNRAKGTQLHYQQKREPIDETWKGPGNFHPSVYGESSQEAFWRRWLKEMAEGKADRIVRDDACNKGAQ
ncbi:hypothetical protein D3C77_658850 [compost metagenome]